MVPPAGEPYTSSARVQAVPAPPVGGPDDAVGLGGDEGLVVYREQQEGLDKLGLDGGRPDGEEGLPGEDGGALGHRPDVAGEPEVLQILQKALAEAALAPQIGDVLLVEAEPLHIVDDLLQTGGDGEAAAVRHVAEKDVEIADLLGVARRLEVAVAHGQFIEITEQGVVHMFLHGVVTSRLMTVICRASIRSSTFLWSVGSGPAVQEASTTSSASGRAALAIMALDSTHR